MLLLLEKERFAGGGGGDVTLLNLSRQLPVLPLSQGLDLNGSGGKGAGQDIEVPFPA